jgi:hypothetical protein
MFDRYGLRTQRQCLEAVGVVNGRPRSQEPKAEKSKSQSIFGSVVVVGVVTTRRQWQPQPQREEVE